MAEEESKSRATELKEEGNAFFAKGELEKAVVAYTKGLDEEPENHVLLSNRAAAYLKQGKVSEAVKDAEKCVALAPDWAKGYTRLAQALYRAEKMKECEKAIDKLEALEPENHTIGILRNSLRLKSVFEQLKGKWHGRVSPELGGYLQEFDFQTEARVLVSVFGRTLQARLRLNVGVEPGHLDILVQQEPDQPPAPEVKHIFKIEGDVLYLCSPYMTPPTERPTKFEGPALVEMKRGEIPEDSSVKQRRREINALPVEDKCIRFAKDVTEMVPKYKLPEGFESLSEASPEAQDVMLKSVKFQNEYFNLKNLYGDVVEEKLQRYLVRDIPCKSPELAAAVDKLRIAMQDAGMFPREEDAKDDTQMTIEELAKQSGATLQPPSSSVSVAAEAASSISETKKVAEPAKVSPVEKSDGVAAEKPKAEVVSKDNTTTLLIIGAVAVTAGALAFILLRNKSK